MPSNYTVHGETIALYCFLMEFMNLYSNKNAQPLVQIRAKSYISTNFVDAMILVQKVNAQDDRRKKGLKIKTGQEFANAFLDKIDSIAKDFHEIRVLQRTFTEECNKRKTAQSQQYKIYNR